MVGFHGVAPYAIPALILVVLAVGSLGAAAAPGSVGFGTSEIIEERGDVAVIPLQFSDEENATVQVTAAAGNYTATVDVTDGNKDGVVHLEFNTFHGVDQPEASAFTVRNASDSVRVRGQSTSQSVPVLAAGRYHVIADANHSRIATTLRLTPIHVGEGTTTVAHAPGPNAKRYPAKRAVGQSTADEASQTDPPAVIAERDAGYVEFNISGIGGAMQTAPPAEDLVFPNTSTAQAETTHLVQLAPDQPLTVNRSVTIDYTNGTEPELQPVIRTGIHTIGIDRDGDGRIDRSLKFKVASVKVETNERITITFTDPTTLAPDETLLVKYPVVNPAITGTDTEPVSVRVDDNYTKSGQIRYGPDLGTLGNGIDVRIRSLDGSGFVHPLGPLGLSYDNDANTLAAQIDPAKTSTGTYAVTLTVNEPIPIEQDEVGRTETVTVVERTATVRTVEVLDNAGASTTNSSQETDRSPIEVLGVTNLAPDNEVAIEVYIEGDDSIHYSHCVTQVASRGIISCLFEPPTDLVEHEVHIAVTHDGTRLVDTGVPAIF